MDLALIVEKVAIALGLGLLVGLQREHVQSPLAGIRTFALITVLGAVCALLGVTFGSWIVAAGAVALTILLAAGNLGQPKAKELDPGLTTEIAALLMYAVGAYLMVGSTALALVLGGVVAVLLQFKAPMHEFVARIGETDLKAIMQFVLIALVIFPVLPDESFGPYGVFNPHNIWLMVVLIVGISLGGYVSYKLFGQNAGAFLGGMLGGMISSTATTVSYARRAHAVPACVPLAALGVVVASTIAFLRVLAEIAIVAPTMFWQLAAPLLTMFIVMVALSLAMYVVSRGEHVQPPLPENPAELKSALLFGGAYTLVLLATALAQQYLGPTGLYGVAVFSGLHDLDAITLSTARLVDKHQVSPGVSWRLILTAALVNFGVKGGITAVLGNARLLARIAGPFLLAIVAGILLLLLWPRAT